ncbi:MAG TPA: hypothetical protein VN803_11895 [Gemmatimonadales bacterium]|nr:hypothetical protein [Gemmatimonadales bacterium]
MRFTTKILTTGAALVLATAPVAPRAQAALVPAVSVATVRTAVAIPVAVTSAVQDAKIEVNVNDKKGGAWYTNPVWIAIGIIALVLIIALLMMAGRGRDTTVVK